MDTLLDTAISLEPRGGIFFLHRGKVKATLEQYVSVISDFDRVIYLTAGKLFPLGYYDRGLATYCLSECESSMLDFDIEIKQNTNTAEAYYYRGLAKTALNQINEAEQDLRAALKFVPKEGDVQLKNEIENALSLINT